MLERVTVMLEKMATRFFGILPILMSWQGLLMFTLCVSWTHGASISKGQTEYFDDPTGQYRPCSDICEPLGSSERACARFCPNYVHAQSNSTADEISHPLKAVEVGVSVGIGVLVAVVASIAIVMVLIRRRKKIPAKKPVQETGYRPDHNGQELKTLIPGQRDVRNDSNFHTDT
ncbi:uncharacterized protein LOC127836296 [Dreissena polymorpha]|uniref:Uncharacterized protein n=1 Tax=Dreissena polymorpha TaxID=45954 RepID=A0A9D4JHL3_DREPO|nr:uncharacterized protein LOC127836296 [Dreissena polymorpha]KAH3810394.1 hypothetical protein DPMN_138786 [Dreissena polymorpha]